MLEFILITKFKIYTSYNIFNPDYSYRSIGMNNLSASADRLWSRKIAAGSLFGGLEGTLFILV